MIQKAVADKHTRKFACSHQIVTDWVHDLIPQKVSFIEDDMFE